MKSRSFRHFVEEELGNVPRFFIYAMLELTLMAILFLDGALAYAANVFAELFELVPPCLLCTRVNPLFDRADHHDLHYNTTMCEAHKKEISSFAYCRVHRKLSDLQTMCEACLLAFASDDNSSIASATNDNNKDIDSMFNDELRSRLKTQGHFKDDPAMQGNAGHEKPSSDVCSCCGEPMKAKSSFQKPGFANSNVPGWVAQAPCSSPRNALGPWKNEEANGPELPQIKHPELKPPKSNSTSALADEEGGNVSNQVKEDVRPDPISIPSLHPESEAMTEEVTRTPSFARGGNRLLSMLSGDSTTASPRFASRTPRKSFGERIEFPDDLLENAGANEPEDSIVNRLKKQMKLDRKSLIELSKELDEERSASAVAANNAMAMITRLQAEKASVQMEALQYQRMMDEQAEYDQEALCSLHELLEKREYEMLDMQDELELYRERYGVLGDDVFRRVDHFEKVQSFASFTEKSDHGDEDGVDDDDHEDGGDVSPDESVFDIETEVDRDAGINYYDQAYALYENAQLQGGEEEQQQQKEDVDEEYEGKIYEEGGAVEYDQLGVLEATNQTSPTNDDDQNTTNESDRVGKEEVETENEGMINDIDDSILISSEHEHTDALDKVEVSESKIQNSVEDGPNEESHDERNYSQTVEEVPELGGEVTGES